MPISKGISKGKQRAIVLFINLISHEEKSISSIDLIQKKRLNAHTIFISRLINLIREY